MTLHDLSQVFRPGVHANAEDDVSAAPSKTTREHGVNAFAITFGSHAGTHIDAPLHLDDTAVPIDRLPLTSFAGTGVVLDLRRGADERIEPEDIRAATPDIRRGDIVLIETGWSSQVDEPDYRQHHPWLSPAGAQWLVAAGAKAVGIDASSVDAPKLLRGPGFSHDTLRILLAAEIPVIHGLVNLAAVRGRRVEVFAFPVLFAGVDAGPARVVARTMEG